jgi:eukaryotic-like serine/threonine-protein kinase
MIPGTVIQDRYRIDGIHSEEGGMGSVLLVHDLVTNQGPLALKYCREGTEEQLTRFRREVRLMQSFAGNQRIVQLIAAELNHDPPFFVMPFYHEGDLRTLIPEIANNPTLQESVFLLMVDCVSELHRQNTFHRDIKPQNFLRNGAAVVVSDFGLSMELDSKTLFTRSSQYWGTQGFIPPEFVEPGGFKNASAESDIFMLGKSFYVLATGRDPQFLNEALLSRPLAFIVERCCKFDPSKRFRTLAQLRQAIVAAFDVILRRTDAHGEADFVLDEVVEELKRDNRYDAEKISEFLDRFGNLDVAARWALIQRFTEPLLIVVAQPSFDDKLDGFLALYEEVVLSKPTSFAYAETVSQHMAAVFKHSANVGGRAKAFEIAVKMAARMNRFAAMEKCISMLSSVPAGDPAGDALAAVIMANPEEFLKGQEAVTIKNVEIRLAIQAIKAQ